MKVKTTISFIFAAAFLIFLFTIPEKPVKITHVIIGGQNMEVDLAVTKSDQEKGLSGRTPLAENQGMLFVFNTPGIYPFWMKDMNFPIDIIWLSEDMKVNYIQKNADPASYPQTFGGTIPNKYVLEVVSGFSDTNHVKIGDSASFSY